MRWSMVLFPVALMACNDPTFRDQLPAEPARSASPLQNERITDTHVQVTPPEADILFVISNWWSSEQLTQELIDAFDDMLNELIDSGVNYHIGVISTDTDHSDDNGKLREGLGHRWIDIENQRPLVTFAQMATMEASGCVGPRRPRDATYMALEIQADTHNLGFRRPAASMHTIFVSDDRDASYHLSVDEFIDWYGNFGPNPHLDSLSAIVDTALDAENVSATTVLNGSSHDIDDTPWENIMRDIGLHARGPQAEFPLSRIPNVETLDVRVHAPTGVVEYDLNEDFTYIEGRNTVHFGDYRPPSGARIEISYEPLR